MPTNFTVVPVEDTEDDNNSVVVAGSSRPVSLGKIFGEKDEDNLQETPSGKNTLTQSDFSVYCLGLCGDWGTYASTQEERSKVTM